MFSAVGDAKMSEPHSYDTLHRLSQFARSEGGQVLSTGAGVGDTAEACEIN